MAKRFRLTFFYQDKVVLVMGVSPKNEDSDTVPDEVCQGIQKELNELGYENDRYELSVIAETEGKEVNNG